MMDEQQDKKIINALHSLKHEKAPADFLSSVHARIEKRSQLAEIINAIFQPLQIKIPLQLAGVALTITLIILVNQSNQPPIPSAVVPPTTKMAKSVARPIAVAAKPKAITNKTFAIALVFNEESEGKAATPQNTGVADQAAGPAEKGGRESLISAKKCPDDTATKTAPSCEIDKNWYEEQASNNKIKSDKNFSKLIQLVKEAKGEIILIERQKESDKPKALAAKIPSINISSFLKQVNQLGKITIPAIPEFNGKYILVRIDISY